MKDEDWDNLIILDACRYDLFEDLNTIEGELTTRKSVGSNTPEFLQANFSGQDFSDTVYVTSNPQVNVHLENEFFEIINVWENHWDGNLNTVHPEVMATETIGAYQAYPDKRLIAHFIQPHYPFIGDIGQKELGSHSGMEYSKRLAQAKKGRRDQKSVWEQLYNRTVDPDIAWRAYRENLHMTLPHVERVVNAFQEQTVVTSDHGNAFGERSWPIPVKIFGHPPEIRIPALTKVPWLVIDENNRKEVISEQSSADEVGHQEIVSERLADLGYK